MGETAFVYDTETIKKLQGGSAPGPITAVEPIEEKKEALQERSPGEEKARKEGWTGKDSWKGDAADWVDYPEFNRRGELMGRIQKQTKEIRGMQAKYDEVMETLNSLAEHNSKIAEVERKKVLKELRAEKAVATREENDDEVALLEEQIDELKDADLKPASEPQKPQGQQQQLAPAQLELQRVWMDHPRNQEAPFTSKLVQGAMGTLGDEIYAEHVDADGNFVDITAEQFMEKLVGAVEDNFPHMFPDKKKRTPPSRVSDSGDARPITKAGKSSGKYGFGDLSEDQQRACKKFEQQKIMTRQEYVDQIAAMQELPAQTGE